MSSRGSPVSKELADPPTNPFQPVLASTASRRPIVRRRAPAEEAHARAPARPGTPFGEIGKEDDDNYDVLSLLSGTSGWVGGEEVDEETAAYLPRVRDLRQRRPVVRKKTGDVPEPAAEAASSEPAPVDEGPRDKASAAPGGSVETAPDTAVPDFPPAAARDPELPASPTTGPSAPLPHPEQVSAASPPEA